MMIPISDMMSKVRVAKPLVHHITNYVTVNDCANICICAGGSPVMTDEYEDLRDMVKLASAVVINIGTLNSRTVASMVAAGETANAEGKPVILDPVGVGATPYRNHVARILFDNVRFSVIKGNAGEIGILAGVGGQVRGVDSVSGGDGTAARELAKISGAIVGMTGETDYVSNGERTLALSNGHSLMDRVSGTGCMASSVVGCYVGACGASLESVASGISAFTIAGELAAKKSSGPGTFKANLFDSLYGLTPEQAQKALKCSEL